MEAIVGKTPTKIWFDENSDGNDRLNMAFNDGTVGQWSHSQDCCETVYIEDVTGDWSDLLGHPLLVADERTSDNHESNEARNEYDSNTWTFYTFRNVGGSVDVRRHGSSNGYYSESVDFRLLEPSESKPTAAE